METLASGEIFTLVVIVAAALCIGVGVIFPALGQARAVSQAIEAIARQPNGFKPGIVGTSLPNEFQRKPASIKKPNPP